MPGKIVASRSSFNHNHSKILAFPMSKDYFQKIQQHFSHLIDLHGDSVRAVDWGGEAQQTLRFEVLFSCLQDPAGPQNLMGSILDVGCGRGDLYHFLRERGFCGKYVGVDITDGMVQLSSKRFPNAHFEVRDVVRNPFPEPFDAVIASGIFYLRSHQQDYAHTLMATLYQHARHVAAFNVLSAHAKEKQEHEVYFEPGELVSFCQTLTPFVKLFHEYKQNDCAIALYREPQRYSSGNAGYGSSN
jgi:SAM-dependent methyltransferase